jgi:hypothetical protein
VRDAGSRDGGTDFSHQERAHRQEDPGDGQNFGRDWAALNFSGIKELPEPNLPSADTILHLIA